VGKMKTLMREKIMKVRGLDDEDFFWVGIDDGSGLVHE